MARGRKRETPGNIPTQRALRAGGLIVVGLLCAISTSAMAEVCDKAVGDSWMPAHGPVWLLNPVWFPIGLVLLTAWAIFSALSRTNWPAFTGAAFLALWILPAWFVADYSDSIHQAMLREGCISASTQLKNNAVLAAFGIAYLFIGIWRIRRAKKV